MHATHAALSTAPHKLVTTLCCGRVSRPSRGFSIDMALTLGRRSGGLAPLRSSWGEATARSSPAGARPSAHSRAKANAARGSAEAKRGLAIWLGIRALATRLITNLRGTVLRVTVQP